MSLLPAGTTLPRLLRTTTETRTQELVVKVTSQTFPFLLYI